MKIKEYQAGGYIAYQPLPMIPQQQAAQPQQPAQAAQQDEGYLDKDVLNKMLGQGITTDVMKYSGEIENANRQYQNMSDFERQSYKGRQLRSMLKGDLGQLNALVRSKTTFDDAIKNAKSNDALDELAVTNTGVIATDNETGKLTEVKFDQYAKNKDKYTALTNAQLAQQREYNKDLVGNENVFSILNFGVGMDKIKKEIYTVVSHITGKTSSSTANGNYSTPDADTLEQLTAQAKTGAFKIKSGTSDSSNIEQIKAAKATLWDNLSANAKAVLRARAAQKVTDPSKVEQMAILEAMSLLDPATEVSHSVTYDESISGGGKGAKGAKGEALSDFGGYGAAYNMKTNVIPISQIGSYGVKIDGFAAALPVDAYSDKDNNRVPLRNAAKLNNISYLSKAFVANGDKVNPDSTVITGDAYVTTLPYKKMDDGSFAIDEEGAKHYAEYAEAAQQAGLNPLDPNPELRAKFGAVNLNLKKFVVAEAASYDEKAFFSNRDKTYYSDVTPQEKGFMETIIDPKQDGIRHGFDPDVHKHLIFIPAKDERTFNAEDGNNAKVPTSVYNMLNGYNSGRGGATTPDRTYGSRQLDPNDYNANTAFKSK